MLNAGVVLILESREDAHIRVIGISNSIAQLYADFMQIT